MNHMFIDLQKYPIHLNRCKQKYPYKHNFRKKKMDLTLESVRFVCLGFKDNTTGGSRVDFSEQPKHCAHCL